MYRQNGRMFCKFCSGRLLLPGDSLQKGRDDISLATRVPYNTKGGGRFKSLSVINFHFICILQHNNFPSPSVAEFHSNGT